eukprot:129012-Chlamydomonas_euryale.AAC.1
MPPPPPLLLLLLLLHFRLGCFFLGHGEVRLLTGQALLAPKLMSPHARPHNRSAAAAAAAAAVAPNKARVRL